MLRSSIGTVDPPLPKLCARRREQDRTVSGTGSRPDARAPIRQRRIPPSRRRQQGGRNDGACLVAEPGSPYSPFAWFALQELEQLGRSGRLSGQFRRSPHPYTAGAQVVLIYAPRPRNRSGSRPVAMMGRPVRAKRVRCSSDRRSGAEDNRAKSAPCRAVFRQPPMFPDDRVIPPRPSAAA